MTRTFKTLLTTVGFVTLLSSSATAAKGTTCQVSSITYRENTVTIGCFHKGSPISAVLPRMVDRKRNPYVAKKVVEVAKAALKKKNKKIYIEVTESHLPKNCKKGVCKRIVGVSPQANVMRLDKP